MRSDRHVRGSHRWTHFFGHLRIFVYVMLLLVLIDVVAGDGLWVHWAAGLWGAILAMHFVETLFFGGGAFGVVGGSHCFDKSPAGPHAELPKKIEADTKL